MGIFIYNLTAKSLEKFSAGEGKVNSPFGVCLDSRNILYETDFNTQNIAIYTPLQLQYANLGVQINQIWMSAYPNNMIHLRVWDKAGKPINNLKEENIQLFEEGTEIPLIRFGPTYDYRKNLYAKIIVDKSLAMQDYEQDMLESLNSFLKAATGSDWIDIITVSDKTESTGKIPASVLKPIDFINKQPFKSNEPANLDKAFHEAINGLLNVNRNKAIILLTSGEIGNNTFGDYDADMLLNYAKYNAIPVYIINFSDKNRDVFERIADSTYGKYYTIKDIKEINNLYTKIKKAPPLEYIISYEALNLKGLRNYWVDVHLKIKYKDLAGVDDTGYFVPEFTSESGVFNFNRER